MKEVQQALSELNFDKNTEVYYIQEEHVNMASFDWCKMHIKQVMKRLGSKNPSVQYIGRDAEASIATANSKDFKATEAQFLHEFKQTIGIKV